MRWLLPLLVLGCSSSSTSSADEGPKCNIGQLTGAWHIIYLETDGMCGPITEQTVMMNGQPPGGGDVCKFTKNSVSADKCSTVQEFTCPLASNTGNQQWTGTMRTVDETKLQGSYTLQVSGSATCRSTYAITWTKQ